MALLEIERVVVRYGKALALDGASVHADRGELVGVLGPNGAGKTTLLRAIARMVPSTGTLRFAGADLQTLPPHRVAAHGIGHCAEGRHLFAELTVGKNLELGAYLRRDRDGVAQDLERMLALFPVLRERHGQIAGTLSGGEQQMLAIARALMCRPSLLLLDEPSTGLSHRIKRDIFRAIARIRRDGVTVLLVEQDAVSTFEIADRIYVLEQGRIAKEGTAADLAKDEGVRQIYLGVA
ncbi:MAG: ABC transporter ATP-binding protein [Deltaproteobacteria bacterium]|nr:MAG: ABC transporter ATP-binding protein [Deltaproteobacteria bacterium]TMB36594.1 MAG: ABC transporter ATP-binding protein [Deltaproteobacteria bacterium]